MRKYKPVTTFMAVGQYETLRVLAEHSRDPKHTKVPDESISSLTRQAVAQFLSGLEELHDAKFYPHIADGYGAVSEKLRPVTAIDPRI